MWSMFWEKSALSEEELSEEKKRHAEWKKKLSDFDFNKVQDKVTRQLVKDFFKQDLSFIENHIFNHVTIKSLYVLNVCKGKQGEDPLQLLNLQPEKIKEVFEKLFEELKNSQGYLISKLAYIDLLKMVTALIRNGYKFFNIKLFIDENKNIVTTLQQLISDVIAVKSNDRILVSKQNALFQAYQCDVSFFSQYPFFPTKMTSNFCFDYLTIQSNFAGSGTAFAFLSIEHINNIIKSITTDLVADSCYENIICAILKYYNDIIQNTVNSIHCDESTARDQLVAKVFAVNSYAKTWTSPNFEVFQAKYNQLRYIPFYFDCFRFQYRLNKMCLSIQTFHKSLKEYLSSQMIWIFPELQAIVRISDDTFRFCFQKLASESSESANELQEILTQQLKNIKLRQSLDLVLNDFLIIRKYALVNAAAKNQVEEYIKFLESKVNSDDAKFLGTHFQVKMALEKLSQLFPDEKEFCQMMLQTILDKLTRKNFFSETELRQMLTLMKNNFCLASFGRSLIDKYEVALREKFDDTKEVLSFWGNVIDGHAVSEELFDEASYRIAEHILSNNARVTNSGGLEMWLPSQPNENEDEEEKEKEKEKEQDYSSDQLTQINDEQKLINAVQALEFLFHNKHPDAEILKRQVFLVLNSQINGLVSRDIPVPFASTTEACEHISTHYFQILNSDVEISAFRRDAMKCILLLAAPELLLELKKVNVEQLLTDDSTEKEAISESSSFLSCGIM